jgi:hypothetical protein
VSGSPDAGLYGRRWDGTWDPDDPDANLKADVAALSRADPSPAFEGLSARTGVPVEALVRYALVRWGAEGAEALLALGPRTVARLGATIDAAEAAGTDAARLEAYAVLRDVVAWLRAGLDEA